MSRETYCKTILGEKNYNTIKHSRILMVGAGGIGCELLKNLVLVGFGEIHMVDLDTIDLSNLNRQFLFRKQHIKCSKAQIAKQSAQKFNPNVKIVPHHANIKDPQFSLSWFKSFNIVFNALDNLDARRHVNKMCLTASVPLIESGTTGFNGQVQVILPDKTECYDCIPKETPKTFPICTIRSTPSQPIHCIVWAKDYLFSQIFGPVSQENNDDNENENSNQDQNENDKEIENLNRETDELKSIRTQFGEPQFADLVIDKVFKKDIQRLLSAEGMWKYRKPPKVLDFESFAKEIKELDIKTVLKKENQKWSPAENYLVFLDSFNRLTKRALSDDTLESKSKTPAPLFFDKDDIDTLDFVSAVANLRSLTFDIETKSRFDIKQMAGNIIPAIATTNAIVAGICVPLAFKILSLTPDQLNDKNVINSQLKNVFLSRQPERLFTTDPLNEPNPFCTTSGVSRGTWSVDLSQTTLREFVEDALIKGLNYGEEIGIITEKLLYDIEFDDNLDKTLLELGINSGGFVTIVDENNYEDVEKGPRANLELFIEKLTPENDTDLKKKYMPIKVKELKIMPKKEQTANDEDSENDETNKDDLKEATGVPQKRKLEDGDLVKNDDTSKRSKGDDVIDLEEDESILIE